MITNPAELAHIIGGTYEQIFPNTWLAIGRGIEIYCEGVDYSNEKWPDADFNISIIFRTSVMNIRNARRSLDIIYMRIEGNGILHYYSARFIFPNMLGHVAFFRRHSYNNDNVAAKFTKYLHNFKGIIFAKCMMARQILLPDIGNIVCRYLIRPQLYEL